MNVAYVRVSTDKQELQNQRFEIDRFSALRGLTIDEWDEEVVSGTLKVKDRSIGRVLERLQPGDTLIVSEVSRISRRLSSILNVIESCVERGVTIMTVKENIVFDGGLNSQIMAFAFGMAAQIERSLISARTKEALARKRAEGMVLGRPVGSTRPEGFKLHGKDEQIIKLLNKRVSMSAIARLLDVHRHTLTSYVRTQDLRRRAMLKRLEETGV